MSLSQIAFAHAPDVARYRFTEVSRSSSEEQLISSHIQSLHSTLAGQFAGAASLSLKHGTFGRARCCQQKLKRCRRELTSTSEMMYCAEMFGFNFREFGHKDSDNNQMV